jgi:hypothetical protein
MAPFFGGIALFWRDGTFFWRDGTFFWRDGTFFWRVASFPSQKKKKKKKETNGRVVLYGRLYLHLLRNRIFLIQKAV